MRIRQRSVIVIAVISILLAITMNFWGFFATKHLLENFISEIASVGVGVFVGVFLVDRFVQHDRKAQWAKSRDYVLGGIVSHLADLTSDIFIFLPISDHRPMGRIFEGRNKPSNEVPEVLRDLANTLRNIKDSWSSDKSLSDLTIEYYERAKWDMDQIQGVLTPRVLQSEPDQDLINSLMGFDQARRNHFLMSPIYS